MIIWRILNHIYIHVQYNLTSTKTMCKEKKKKDQIEISPISKRLLFCFLNFQYILIYVRKQIIKGC